jgi:hypothetical protein
MFAVGMSLKDPSLRYIKQIKVRTGEFKYGADHVDICKIEKSGSFLGFTHVGYSTEEEQLKGKANDVVTKGGTKRRKLQGKRINKRMFRSELAEAQIDLVSQMAEEAFAKFSN